ncbi:MULTISPECIES: MFS transporter [unclassified Microbacterium]|uniref:MFS transporter n=1 Tax=unclassified Microbacterium TaxID=2609290 RepID=UPI0012F78A5F|nr:MFS transporter [Microbacterium sp. MAH-37]MVQ42016.1 MFS transporter [Microbacterium sp. MAH-37]
MASGVGPKFAEAAAAFASNWGNASLRRAQLSFLSWWAAECAFAVALSIVAYGAGGTLAVGLVGLVTMLPAALLTPLLAPLADRVRRERVLVAVTLLRAASMVAAAVIVLLAGPIVLVYAIAALSSVTASLYRPAHSALLPTLCRTGRELAGANVVRGLLDSSASLIGPLLAAVLLALAGPAAVLLTAAAGATIAALLVLRLHYEGAPTPPVRRPALVAEAAEGLRAVGGSRPLRLMLALIAAQTFTRGALSVFSVVVAIELLRMGEAGAGALMAALGMGAVLGSLASSVLIGTWRLGAWFAIGVGMWGLPIALIGAFPQQATALALLAVVGLANALIDAAGFTLIGRLTPDAVMARVFGVLEAIVAITMGIGSLVASALAEVFGVETALLAIGVLCPALAIASWWRLRRIDRTVREQDAEIALLREVPLFGPLPLSAIEHLARGLEPVEVPQGTTVFAQGDIGDRYYLIESGEAEVLGDGRVVATLGPGEGFGEIALLRRTVRTATVRARTDLRLRALTAERFTTAVLGFSGAASAADEGMDDELARFRPAG